MEDSEREFWKAWGGMERRMLLLMRTIPRYIRDMARELETSAPLVRYHLRKLGDVGLARRLDENVGRGERVFWDLTPEGRDFVDDVLERVSRVPPELAGIDVSQDNDSVTVEVRLPGYGRKDISLGVTEDAVHIKAETKTAEEGETEARSYRMLTKRRVERTTTLPARVVPEKARASYQRGVLRVVVPKSKKGEKAAFYPEIGGGQE